MLLRREGNFVWRSVNENKCGAAVLLCEWVKVMKQKWCHCTSLFLLSHTVGWIKDGNVIPFSSRQFSGTRWNWNPRVEVNL